MPSQRRLRLVLIAAFTSMFVLLFWASSTRHAHEDFYSKTVTALEDGPGGGGGDAGGRGRGGAGPQTPLTPQPPPLHPVPGAADTGRDGDLDGEDTQLARDMAERLRAAEQKAKDLANQKAPLRPDKPSELIGVGSSAEGQDKSSRGRARNRAGKKAEPDADVGDASGENATGKSGGGGDEREDVEETTEEHAAEMELSSILKRAPVIIFSKTYCPHSKRAKHILLEQYTIDPAPVVIELDKHPQGDALQAQLAKRTARKTVPNVLVGGVSIGGGDEVAELDRKGELRGKFEYLGSNRVRVSSAAKAGL